MSVFHESTLPVLGVPVRLRTSSPAVLEAFEASLGRWRLLEGYPALISADDVEGTIDVVSGGEGERRPVPVEYRMVQEGRLAISTPASLLRGDASKRRFDGRVTLELLEDAERFRHKVLEAAVLSVVTFLDRQPLHASVIVRGDTALVLAAPSGTGKSTLSYAAARAGFAVLSEDTVFVQLRPSLRLWGMPGSVHLPRAARAHFEELREQPVRALPTGKEKIAVTLASLGAEAPLPFVERAGVCVVERSPGGGVSVEPLSSHALESAISRSGEPGFDLFDASRAELARALAAGGAWRLTLSDDPREAVPTLQRLMDQVEARLGPSRGRGGALSSSHPTAAPRPWPTSSS